MADDILYAAALGFSILVGIIIYEIRSPQLRLHFSTLAGLVITFGVSGTQIGHSLVATLVTFVILRLSSVRYVSSLTFLWVFGYLFFFRLCYLSGFASATAPTNLIQLFLSLKLVSLAFDHADAVKQKQKSKRLAAADGTTDNQHGNLTSSEETSRNQQSETKVDERVVSFYTLFAYAFCFVGLISGPFLRFRTFDDFIQGRVRVPLKERLRVALRRGAALLICVPVYSALYARWPLQTFRDPEFIASESFLKINFLLFAQFLAQRCRLYAAWRAGELMCILSGCGAYPTHLQSVVGGGPTREMTENRAADAKETRKRDGTATTPHQHEMKEADGRAGKTTDDADGLDLPVDFRTVENVDIRVCETSPRIRECARAWNSCVQFWLFNYVHKRLPPSLGAFRTAITMAVSAYWHGLYAGYWFGICSMPILMLAQDMLLRFEPVDAEDASSEQSGSKPAGGSKRSWKKTLFDFAMVQFRMRANEYIAIAISLLDYRDCLRVYNRIYFFWHVILIVLCLISPFVRGTKPKRPRVHAVKTD